VLLLFTYLLTVCRLQNKERSWPNRGHAPSTNLSVCGVSSLMLRCAAVGRTLTRFNAAAAAVIVLVDVVNRDSRVPDASGPAAQTHGRRRRASRITNDRSRVKMSGADTMNDDRPGRRAASGNIHHAVSQTHFLVASANRYTPADRHHSHQTDADMQPCQSSFHRNCNYSSRRQPWITEIYRCSETQKSVGVSSIAVTTCALS